MTLSPASGSFPVSQFFLSGDQSIGASTSASVHLVNIQDWFSFRMDWLDLLEVQGTLKSSPTPQFKSISFELSLLYGPALTSTHDYWKNHSFDYTDLSQQSDVSTFDMLSMFVITFFPRSKHPITSWLQSPSAVILEHKKRKFVSASTFPHLFAMKWWDWMPWS